MKTRLYIFATLSGMLLFACNDEANEPKTRADGVEEASVEIESDMVCFSCMSVEQAADAYDYPLKMGSEVMKDASPSDKVEMNQIPAEILKIMSTNGLVQSALTFPTILSWTFSDNYYDSFIQQTKSITIFKELYSRNDAATCLLGLYKAFDENECQGGTLTLQTMDMLIAQPDIYTKFTGKEVAELFETAIRKIENQPKVDEEDVLWWFGGDKFLFMGKIMYHLGYKPFVTEVNNNEFLLNYLKKTDTSFLIAISQFGGPEKFQDFFMAHAKSFLNQIK